jgi:hypothetical protein
MEGELMSLIHTPDLKPLGDGDPTWTPRPWKMDPEFTYPTDPAYDNPCRGIMIGVVLGSVFWILVYILVQYFRGMG